MCKALTTALALVATAAAFAAVAAGGRHSAAQRVRIEVTGSDPFTFVLKPMSKGRIKHDTGPMTFCCWRSWNVTRAGARLGVTNPRMTLAGPQGTLKIRERIEWVGIPDDWAVQTGTWKVVGGTGTYAGLSGSGRVASVTTPDGSVRARLFGSLGSK
jgi:hypothetical protein